MCWDLRFLGDSRLSPGYCCKQCLPYSLLLAVSQASTMLSVSLPMFPSSVLLLLFMFASAADPGGHGRPHGVGRAGTCPTAPAREHGGRGQSFSHLY